MTKQLTLARDLRLPLDAVTETFALLAKRGAGKSYTAARLIEQMLKAQLQVCVLDPMGAWWSLRTSADGKRPGFAIAVLGGEHGDVPLEPTGGEVAADLVAGEGLSCVLDVSQFSKTERRRFVTDFAERLFRRNREPVHLVLEEADLFAPQKPIGRDQQRMLGAIEDLVRRGRAKGIGITLITQRSAVLHKDVLTQTEVLLALRTTSPHDRKAIEAWIDVHGVKEERDAVMQSLPSLPVGTAWFWSPGWLGILKRVQIAARETFDASATPKAGKRIRAPKTVADVDLGVLQERMAATIERAKAEDPRELQKRIGQLERDLRTARQAVARETQKTRVVEVPAVQDAQLAQFQRTLHEIDVLTDRLDGLSQQFHELGVQLGVDLRAAQVQAVPNVEITKSRNSTSRRTPLPENPGTQEIHPITPRVNLNRGERAILTAVCQYPEGVTNEQLSVLTGYKRSSRNTYLQRLSTAGLVDRASDGRIIATRAGFDALGPDFEPLPTGAALRTHWLERLPAGEQKILEVLIAQYPAPVRVELLDEITGYKRSSRNTYLQRLTARQLVDRTSSGEVRAAAMLFEA